MGGGLTDFIKEQLQQTDDPPTTSTTSGSSSSSGGSAAPKTESQILAERRANNAIMELQKSYLEVLRRWGLRPSKNLLNLIDRGIKGAWSTTMFISMVRHTRDYHDKFAGISWGTGMSEASYNSQYAQFKNRAKDIGISLSRQVFGRMLHKGLDFEEYSERVDALGAIRENPMMWEAFMNVLQERGIPLPTGKGKKKSLVQFINGRGSKAWEQVWQETFLTANLEAAAGINVIDSDETSGGEGALEIARGQLLKIIKGVEGLSGGKLDLEKANIDFGALGADLRKYDFNYLKKYGLSYADLIQAKLGGPGAADIIARADRVQAEKEAFGQPRALPSQQRALGQDKQQEEDFVQSL